ncbi:hypothetical protein KDL44_07550 [bacterium]|nr:hypothetical protein [bacterium]
MWRESEVVNSATSSSSCLGGLVVYTFFRVFSILLEVVGIPVTDYAGFLPIISLLAIAVSLGAWSLLKKPLQGYYTEFRATAYRKACSELRHGDLLVRLIDGDWVDGLMERINGSFGMRWLVPQRPGKLEDFAVWGACFWDALQDLGSQRPVGRLNLWRGVINHVMLQQKLDRCCCILYFIPGIPLNIPLWIFFSNLYVQRSARMTALVDYLTRRRNLLLE